MEHLKSFRLLNYILTPCLTAVKLVDLVTNHSGGSTKSSEVRPIQMF